MAAGWKIVCTAVQAGRRPFRRLERRSKNITRNEGKAVFSIPVLILVTANDGLDQDGAVEVMISGQNLDLF